MYVTDEILSPPGRLKIWNIENLSEIILEGLWSTPELPNCVIHNIEVYDTIAVIAYYSAGVRLVNISNPTVPVEIGWFDTRPEGNATEFQGCWSVYMFSSGKIIASDENRGLFVLERSSKVGIENTSQEVPTEFLLGNNYPNPFNPVTTINYQVPEQAQVRINIYDMAGRLVSSPVNEVHTAGYYKLTFDASSLSSGVYFYEMNAGRFRQIKRMVLVK